MRRCPVCGRKVEQPRTGRPRIYCCQAHRQRAYEDRHPLGWRHLGADQPSPLRMLADRGVDLSPLRVVDAWVASQRFPR